MPVKGEKVKISRAVRCYLVTLTLQWRLA